MLNKYYAAADAPFGRLDAWKYHENTGAARKEDTFRIALAAQPESEAALNRLAMAYRRPLETAQSWNSVCNAPKEAAFSRISGSEICTTALYRQNGAWICRFWACGVEDGEVTIKVPDDVKTAEKTDLRGRTVEAYPVERGTVTVKLKKFEIVTLKYQ